MPSSTLTRKASAATSEPKQDLDSGDRHNSAQVERWLQGFGVSYSELTDIPLSDVDTRKSRHNQARPEALIPENVERFALQMKEGHVFPPVVGYVDGGKIVYVDGNNRDAARRKAFGAGDSIKGFILAADTPSETIYAMMVDANAHHGETPDAEWRLLQAVNLQEKGLTAEQACRAAAVRPGALSLYRRKREGQERAEQQRVKDFDTLSGTAQVDLSTIEMDGVFAQASQVAVDTNMSSKDVKEFVRDIKAQKSQRLQMEHIVKTRERRNQEAKAKKVAGKRGPVRNAKHSLVSALGKVMAADPAKIAALALTPEDKVEIEARCGEAAEHLIDIMTALNVPKQPRSRVVRS